ncbi:MAG: biopolymer transporter ExbD [Bdellovibrionaceae bacterium]|nr:biopolymer transporter ExbD [Pseudobdellovibrionaceae bacterium]
MKRSKTVVKPGYHIRPKYDLEALRERRHGGGGNKFGVPELPLVSMIDMFTILVIFLLMNFSATGEIFFIPKELKLPEAKHSRPIESAPLITVTSGQVILETEQVGSNPVTLTENDINLPQLSRALRNMKEMALVERPDKPFKGQINIQADETTPLVYIKRVMQTCISEGWTGINFAVRGTGSGTETGVQ